MADCNVTGEPTEVVHDKSDKHEIYASDSHSQEITQASTSEKVEIEGLVAGDTSTLTSTSEHEPQDPSTLDRDQLSQAQNLQQDVDTSLTASTDLAENPTSPSQHASPAVSARTEPAPSTHAQGDERPLSPSNDEDSEQVDHQPESQEEFMQEDLHYQNEYSQDYQGDGLDGFEVRGPHSNWNNQSTDSHMQQPFCPQQTQAQSGYNHQYVPQAYYSVRHEQSSYMATCVNQDPSMAIYNDLVRLNYNDLLNLAIGRTHLLQDTRAQREQEQIYHQSQNNDLVAEIEQLQRNEASHNKATLSQSQKISNIKAKLAKMKSFGSELGQEVEDARKNADMFNKGIQIVKNQLEESVQKQVLCESAVKAASSQVASIKQHLATMHEDIKIVTVLEEQLVRQNTQIREERTSRIDLERYAQKVEQIQTNASQVHSYNQLQLLKHVKHFAQDLITIAGNKVMGPLQDIQEIVRILALEKHSNTIQSLQDKVSIADISTAIKSVQESLQNLETIQSTASTDAGTRHEEVKKLHLEALPPSDPTPSRPTTRQPLVAEESEAANFEVKLAIDNACAKLEKMLQPITDALKKHMDNVDHVAMNSFAVNDQPSTHVEQQNSSFVAQHSAGRSFSDLRAGRSLSSEVQTTIVADARSFHNAPTTLNSSMAATNKNSVPELGNADMNTITTKPEEHDSRQSPAAGTRKRKHSEMRTSSRLNPATQDSVKTQAPAKPQPVRAPMDREDMSSSKDMVLPSFGKQKAEKPVPVKSHATRDRSRRLAGKYGC